MKVLIIDDDEINNFISSKIIKKVLPSCNVKSVLNGALGIDSIKEFQPDIVLLDTNMPIMNGWEFLEAIKDTKPTFKIYIVVSSIFSNDINRFQEYPIVSDIISKPLNTEKLKEILK